MVETVCTKTRNQSETVGKSSHDSIMIVVIIVSILEPLLFEIQIFHLVDHHR